MPFAAASTRRPCSRSGCGAWLVATMSIVPSARPSHGENVLFAAQRRIELVARIVATNEFVCQQQMVRGDLGSHLDAALLHPADEVDGAGGGRMAHVQARADVLGEEHIAGDNRALRRQPATRRDRARPSQALVHLGPPRAARILRMLSDDPAERFDVLEGPPRQGVEDAETQFVTEDPDLRARIRHRSEWRGAAPAARR